MPMPPSETMTTEIEVAARWWADHLNENSFDNGDRFPAGVFAMGLGILGSKVYSPKIVEAFRTALLRRIADAVDRFGAICLSVDYGPGLVLYESLEDAGIDSHSSGLPLKTAMWVKPGKVTLGHGYRAAWVTLYPAPEPDHG